MKTLTKGSKRIVGQSQVFRCASATHWSLASASERMRIHDHRWQDPPGQIIEHDYCVRQCKTTHPLAVQGRPAFCPLGDADGGDHEWVAVRGEAFRHIDW
jgi:hypothetical protein